MAEPQAENEPGVGDVNTDPVKVSALVKQFQNETDKVTSESGPSPTKRTPRHKAFEMFEKSGRIMGMPAPISPRPPTGEENEQTSDGLIGGSDEAMVATGDGVDIVSPTTLKHLTPSRPRGPARRKPTRVHNTGDSEDNETSFAFTEDKTASELDNKDVAKRRHETLAALETAVISFALKISKEKGFDSCTVKQEDLNLFKQLVNLNFPSEIHTAEVEVPTSLVFHVTAESPISVTAVSTGSKSSVAVAAVGGGGVGALFGGAVGFLGGPLGVAAGAGLGGVLGMGVVLYRGKSGGDGGDRGRGDSQKGQFSICPKQVFQQSNGFREDKDKGMAYFKV